MNDNTDKLEVMLKRDLHNLNGDDFVRSVMQRVPRRTNYRAWILTVSTLLGCLAFFVFGGRCVVFEELKSIIELQYSAYSFAIVGMFVFSAFCPYWLEEI